MCKIAFHLQGKMSVDGVQVTGENGGLVMLEGRMMTSASNDAAIARNLGLGNIATAVGADELLDSLGIDAIADYLQEKGLYDALMARMMGVKGAA